VRAMDCDDVAAVVPELALGVLPGDERAAALAHLDHCLACQQLVAVTTGVTDRLVAALAPTVEPPLGFERRVIGALRDTSAPATAPRRHRRVGVLAAAAACLAALTLLIGVPRAAAPSVVAAEMRTPAGALVGEVHLRAGAPAVLSMTLPGWAGQLPDYGAAAGAYALRIERTDGPPRVVPVALNAESSWATALDIDPQAITTVALVDAQGHVWCTGRLG
jgi:hypothetical protein